MLPLFIYFVFGGLLVAKPAYAIPSPDFIVPALSWMTTVIGACFVFFGGAWAWIHRSATHLKNNKKMFWIVFFTCTSIGVCVFAVYIESRQVRAYHEREIRIRQEWKETTQSVQPTAQTSSIPLVAPSSSSTNRQPLISSHVSSSTLLVPIPILKKIVEMPQWSSEIFILDIREAEEQEIGHIIATSTSIRYGDLIHGGIDRLPQNQDILVICWTSMRGSEIARWLRAQGFSRAFAIEGGLQGDRSSLSPGGWIASGLPWEGKSLWSEVHGISLSMTRGQANTAERNSAQIIDVRSTENYAKGHRMRAISLPVEIESSFTIASTIHALSPSQPIMVVCDGYVSCYYARILEIRLTRIGFHVLGFFDER